MDEESLSGGCRNLIIDSLDLAERPFFHKVAIKPHPHHHHHHHHHYKPWSRTHSHSSFGVGSDATVNMALFKSRMLWDNIDKGDLTAVHTLLETGSINLEERDEQGRTFLMVASEKGELNIVRELLEAGCDSNAVDNESWSALLCAAKEGHLEIVIELLEHGAELEHKDMCGWTALMWACYKGRIIVVQELLDRGANPNAKADHNMTPLAWAAGRGHTEIVNMLIAKGAKVNTADKYGTTPLIWACRKGYIDIVDALLAEGANVDASGMNSWTPLLIATKGGHAEVVHSLLHHDPNINAVDKDGLTPLAIAAREGYVEIVQDLLSKGAYVNVTDRAGDSILIHAVKGGQVEVVKALLDKYVDVDTQGAEEKTALYWAVEKGQNEIVRLLLASQPDLEIPTKDEDTALLKAVRNRNEEVVRLLLEKGAKVSACDKRGDTALHIAIRARSKRITELLLRNPRNSRLLYRPNKAGETPYAMDTYHQRGILQGIYGHRTLNASDAENLLGYDIYSSALADILSDPSLSTPITVGLYAKWGSGKSFLINKLQSEMKSFTQQNVEEHFLFTPAIVLLALFLSLVVGEALILGVSLKVGIGISVTVFLLQLIFFGVVVLCDHRYEMKFAVNISTVLGRRQRLLMLLLNMLFCNPRPSKKKDATQFSVRFLFSDCTRLSSVGGEKALAAMIATLCQAVEREYGVLVTRLFRVYKPPEVMHKSRFKLLCCVPYFLIVLLVVSCIAAGVALLVEFPLYKYIAVDSVLIAISVILTLTLVGNIYTWAQTLMALVSSQKRRVLNAADHVDTLKMDGFLQCLKQEVELMSRMVTCMDSFTQDQTRLVVIVDGLDSCEQGKVLQVLDTVKALFCDDNAPYITILAVDPHIIIKGIEHNLKSTFQDSNVNGFDYLRNVVHLPFYLQSQGLKIQHHDSIAPNEERERAISVKLGQVSRQESVSSTSFESKFGGSRRKNRPSEALSGSQLMYASSFDLSNTFMRSDYFSDINPRSMRRLLNIVSVTARLLRAYNIDFKWHRLAAWVNIIEQWPYRVSWIIYFFEESEVLDNNTTLYTLYQRVLPRIPQTKEAEPLLEIDRNARKLEAFLSNQSSNLPRLNVGDLKRFLPCTINLDPYLRKLIRETEHQQEMIRQEMNAMGYPGALPPMSTNPHQVASISSIDSSAVFPPTAFTHWTRPQMPSVPSAMMRAANSRISSINSFAGSLLYPGPAVHGGNMTMMQAPASSSTNFPSHNLYVPGFQGPSRPHPAVFFNNVTELKNWAERDVEGVCALIANLKGVTVEVVSPYTKRIRENNISGLVLQACDLDELRTVLLMRFGDWQLFKAAILSLREWDGGMLGADSQLSPVSSNNSASVTSPGTSAELKDAVSRAKDLPLARHQQGRVVGPKGRRMRRNDSIVQQLSYEAAILHEALEEFAEDSDGQEDDLSARDAIMIDAMGKEESEQTSNVVQGSDDNQSKNATITAPTMGQLKEMITVLDSPQAVSETSGNFLDPRTAEEFSPFLLQQSYPSGTKLPAVGEDTEQGAEEECGDALDPHKHHLLRSLSIGLGKFVRPHRPSLDLSAGYHYNLDVEQGREETEVIALTSMLSGKSTADSPPVEVISPWDREAFAPSSSATTGQRRVSFPEGSPVTERRQSLDRRESYGFTSSGQVISPDQDLISQSEAALNIPSSDKPIFLVGSPPSLSPASSFVMESETHSAGSRSDSQGSEPWQLQKPMSVEPYVRHEVKQKKDSVTDDRESAV